MTRLLAVRHGETAWNREGRLQGWAPVGLNDHGREQARTLAGDLATVLDSGGVDRLVTSDLRRTRETATILRDALDAGPGSHSRLPEPEPTRAFRERHLGVYQGLHVDDLVERHPSVEDIGSVTGLPVTPEAGESLADLAVRVREGAADLTDEVGPDGTVLLLTHGGPIRVLLADAKGMDLETAIREHVPANCSVYEFEVGDDGLGFVGEPCEG